MAYIKFILVVRLTTHLLSSGTKLSSRVIQWGKDHENEARQAYVSQSIH